MSEHLPVTDRERITASLLATCEYACEWADDATLFALAAVLAQHASQVAQRLRYGQGPQEGMPEMSRDLALAQRAGIRGQRATYTEPGLGGIGD